MIAAMIAVVMTAEVMVTSRVRFTTRGNAVCDESRMHGVGRGKRWRLLQNLTYRHL
ncbi:hypothetical protein HXA32_20955 [Salipaludibacillus agaradhaerens]|nr:hypothetical protein [Salipaludibacillus agaradhaerens]